MFDRFVAMPGLVFRDREHRDGIERIRVFATDPLRNKRQGLRLKLKGLLVALPGAVEPAEVAHGQDGIGMLGAVNPAAGIQNLRFHLDCDLSVFQ